MNLGRGPEPDVRARRRVIDIVFPIAPKAEQRSRADAESQRADGKLTRHLPRPEEVQGVRRLVVDRRADSGGKKAQREIGRLDRQINPRDLSALESLAHSGSRAYERVRGIERREKKQEEERVTQCEH